MPASVANAARAIAEGALVVYPTDTLLGLGARATSAEAVDRLLAAKGRPPTRSISFAVSSYEEVEPWAILDAPRRTELRRLLPGPYTLLLPASARARRDLAPALIGPGGTVGIRIPDHPVARDLARRAGPITATSANRHGEAPARSLAGARRALGRSVRVYLAARPRPRGSASGLVDLTGEVARLLPRSSP